MSSYDALRQDPPAYGLPARGYQDHQRQLPVGDPGTHYSETGTNADTAANDDPIMNPGDTCIPEKALDLDFDKCFHEHESTKTFNELNVCLSLCYKYVKAVIYHIFVIFIGIPLVFLYALLNGIMVFLVVWLYQPGLRGIIMLIYATSPLVTVPLQALCIPLVDAAARFFRQIRIKTTLDGSFAERLAAGRHCHGGCSCNQNHQVSQL